MSSPYLISRVIDPVFAVSVGITAAVVRINREEKEKGRKSDQNIESLKRRMAMLFNNNTPAKPVTEKAA